MPKWRLTRKMWAIPLAAVLAIGIVVALAIFVRSYERSDYAPIGLSTDRAAAGDPHHSSARFKHAGAGGPGPSPGDVHTLVVHVESSERIGVIGYFAPTSPDIRYGKARNVGKSWTVRTTVTGRPKYAIIWIRGAKDGTSVSCSITIDGKLADRKRTKGPDGQQICSA
jgi:hypothetical protein